MQVLRTIFGRPIPDPDKVLFTRWACDRFAGGSYCCVPVTATGEDLDVMAESVGDRLFFAGEATRRIDYGTTHGAFLSGLRVGRIISKI